MFGMEGVFDGCVGCVMIRTGSVPLFTVSKLLYPPGQGCTPLMTMIQDCSMHHAHYTIIHYCSVMVYYNVQSYDKSYVLWVLDLFVCLNVRSVLRHTRLLTMSMTRTNAQVRL